jgi:hypothetical protein
MSQITPSNFQAWCRYYTGLVADKTTEINQGLCTERVKTYIKDHLETLMFVAPFLFIKMAPMTFSVTLIIGFVGGVFSKENMERIVANKNKILLGGVPEGPTEIDNTSFKVTLIFVCVILNHFLPFPSLQMFYAAACGLHLGVNVAFYVPDWLATSWAENIDKRLPFLPKFNP